MIYKIFKILALIVFKILYRCEIVGLENMPDQGPFIIAANHKSNLDPLMISALVKPQIRWMAKKELYENKFLAALMNSVGAFPVDRQANDIKAVKTAMKILKSNQILGVFPEGTRVKEIDPSKVKSGVALLAHRTKSKIVPIYVEGNYKIFRKIKVYVRPSIDLSEHKKLTQEEYHEISQEMIKIIYYGVDENRSLSSK